MNSSQKLIEKNNSLRKKLNLKNEVFYSDFLIYMRLGSITKKETVVENILLEILEDILDAQRENIDANKYFGKSPKMVADDILKSIPNSITDTVKLAMTGLFSFAIMTLLPVLANPNAKIDLGNMIFAGIYTCLASMLILKQVARSIYVINRFMSNKVVRYVTYFVLASAILAPVYLILFFVKTPLTFSLNGLTGVMVSVLIMAGFIVWWLRSNDRKFNFPMLFAALVFGILSLIIRIPNVQDTVFRSQFGKNSYAIIIMVALVSFYVVSHIVHKKQSD
ncbi:MULTISPECIES: DUF1129 domain-containing protein [Leuconostoc]|uniref:DUF1129 family protein n=1 Tax=Leuconostoc pseudomesenteroides TaxID=33968 RepID=A0A5B8T314_LEUPS|nr:MULTISPECIES: membrane protein [Leuconostoc]MCC8440834.1 hypothetical protein [Leuconostoc pseudomesenteroides]MDG9733708.1 hypothetical protein [Leuconostoc pseudomesenteroides]MDN2450771.1 hypothetical protein [Leuconostoc sp. UCMA20149]NKZ36209.1 hypothetical protein [Leuconostoc pseudomesenteroides]QEA41473.1 hypothetical protein FGL85_02595 [Leuconostoc pseudomesenteroides]